MMLFMFIHCVTVVKDLQHLVDTLTSRVAALEHGAPAPSSTANSAAGKQTAAVAADLKKEEDGEEEEEEDFELFGSDEVGLTLLLHIIF